MIVVLGEWLQHDSKQTQLNTFDSTTVYHPNKKFNLFPKHKQEAYRTYMDFPMMLISNHINDIFGMVTV